MKPPERERGPGLALNFETPGLASDLEWALQSSQADAALAAEALLHAFYQPVYFITCTLGGSEEAQQNLLRAVFVSALHSRYRYRSGMDARSWFYAALVQAIPAAQRQAWPPLAVTLMAFSGLKTGRIAHLLKVPEQKVRYLLAELERRPQAALEEAGWQVDAGFAAQLDEGWRRALQARCPAAPISDESFERLAEELAGLAERQGATRRRLLTVRELALVGLAIAAVLGLLLLANRLFPAAEPDPAQPPGQPSVVVTRVVTRIVGQSEPVYQVVTPTPTRRQVYPTPSPVSPLVAPRSISAEQDPWRLRERMRTSPLLWDTLAATLRLQGRPSRYFFGPQLDLEVRLWVSGNQLRLTSQQGAGGQPTLLLIGSGERLVQYGSGEIERQDYAAPAGGFKPLVQGQRMQRLAPVNLALGLPGISIEAGLAPLQDASAAGRPAVLVEQLDPAGGRLARLWLDQATAVILRAELFDPRRPQDGALYSLEMDQAAFNVDFPLQGMFDVDSPGDPLRSGRPAQTFGPASPTGGDLSPTPAGFDPAGSDLVFRSRPGADLQQAELVLSISAQGAGETNYLLGRVPFGNPYTLICTRSPDGRYLAYASRAVFSPSDLHAIRWYDLANLSQGLGERLVSFSARELAFDRTGRSLAILGRGPQGEGVYLVGLDRQQAARLLLPTSELAQGLGWSPDGQYLAFTDTAAGSADAAAAPARQPQLVIAAVQGGRPVYQGEYPAPAEAWPPGFSPADYAPQTPFPRGLDNCAPAPR